MENNQNKIPLIKMKIEELKTNYKQDETFNELKQFLKKAHLFPNPNFNPDQLIEKYEPFLISLTEDEKDLLKLQAISFKKLPNIEQLDQKKTNIEPSNNFEGEVKPDAVLIKDGQFIFKEEPKNQIMIADDYKKNIDEKESKNANKSIMESKLAPLDAKKSFISNKDIMESKLVPLDAKKVAIQLTEEAEKKKKYSVEMEKLRNIKKLIDELDLQPLKNLNIKKEEQEKMQKEMKKIKKSRKEKKMKTIHQMIKIIKETIYENASPDIIKDKIEELRKEYQKDAIFDKLAISLKTNLCKCNKCIKQIIEKYKPKLTSLPNTEKGRIILETVNVNRK